MVLDNFRTQKIIWDRANRKIFEAIEANSGDSNGRKLVVQVINQEVSENLSGTTLSLGWKSRNGAKGLDAFNVVDASKGIFEIYYTTEMLSNIGNIEASLILIDSTGRIESSAFTISVTPSTVDDESVESENSFTALTEALVKVNDFDAQLAQKIDKGNVSVADINKNLSKLDQTYMSDDLIQQIAGTAPVNAVVANGGVTSEKVAMSAITHEKTDFASIKNLTVNLFDKTKITTGGYINYSTGVWTEDDLFAESDFIMVEPNTQYTKKYAGHVIFYDAYKVKVGGADTITFTTAGNVYFIRYSVLLTSLETEMIVKGATVPSTYVPFSAALTFKGVMIEGKDVNFLEVDGTDYALKHNVTAAPTNIPEAFSQSSNLIDETKITANKVPSLANGILIDNDSYSASDFIPVTAGLQYTQNLTAYKVFYNIDKVFISSSDGVNTVTAPPNAAYMRVAIKNDQLPGIAQLNIGSALLPYEKFGYKLNADVAVSGIKTSQTDGLKVVVLGDSISNGNLGTGGADNYVDLLPDRLVLSSIVNYSYDGSTIANVSGVEPTVDPYPMVDRYATMDADADIVIVFGGTNDYGRGINYDTNYTGAITFQSPLGAETSMDKTTFNGALNLMLDGLITKYPDALIVGILPLHRYHDEFLNTRGLSLLDYVEAERKAYEKFGIPTLDLYANGSYYPTNAKNKATWTPDGLHPNGNYHRKILTQRLANFVESLL